MENKKLLFKVVLLLIFYLTSFEVILSQDSYSDDSYLFGRQYYALRSGRVKMIVQADKVGLSPAFSYLLFDTDNSSQTSQKKNAFNYTEKDKYFSSAIGVRMKSYTFNALPGNCYSRWMEEGGIPSAEAVWWASGVKVKEIITPLGSGGIFRRSVSLTAADMATTDTVYLRLSLPNRSTLIENSIFLNESEDVQLGLKIVAPQSITIISDNQLEIGPIILKPGESKEITTFLLVQLPKIDKQSFLSQAIELTEIEKKLEMETRLKWELKNRISTKDTLVQNMFDVSRYILPGYIADKGTMDAGHFEYGLQWVRDASNTTLGLIHNGEFELAHAALEHMLKNMIKDEGVTMISGGFDELDREQFDQMGEFIHVMKAYVDWTGDVSLLQKYRKKIISMIERPINKAFRDKTGMVHNRREFWERTFEDAYELAYQLWVVTGLIDAADLVSYLGIPQKAAGWRKEAEIISQAALSNPEARLIDNNHLIKRRNINKEIVTIIPYYGWVPGAPGNVESMSNIYPDATMALPVAMHFIDPKSEIAKNTIQEMEVLWNRRWSFGGYDRYNTSSQGDMPGPWTFATIWIRRGQHEAGLLELSCRSMRWLYDISGGHSGSWYEEIPIIHASSKNAGLIPWTTAEVSYFIIHHLLGIKFKGEQMIIKPVLFDTTAPLSADLRFRDSRIELEINGNGPVEYALVNDLKLLPEKDGTIIIPKGFKGGKISIITR